MHAEQLIQGLENGGYTTSLTAVMSGSNLPNASAHSASSFSDNINFHIGKAFRALNSCYGSFKTLLHHFLR